jgi:DNA-binding transcriptional LysR family regulator
MQTAQPHPITLTNVDGQQANVKLPGRVSASDITFLLDLARRCRGPVLALSFMVEDDLREGRLQRILLGWTTQSLPFTAILPSRFLIPSTSRSFVDFMSEWFRN